MKYRIEGDFNSGIYAYKGNEIILFSTRKLLGLDKVEISVFDSRQNLIVKFKNGNTSFNYSSQWGNLERKTQIQFDERKGFSCFGRIKIGDIETLKMKYRIIGLLNPYIKVLLNNKKIGSINKNFFTLVKKYSVDLLDKYNEYHYYILLYVVLFETEFDHD